MVRVTSFLLNYACKLTVQFHTVFVLYYTAYEAKVYNMRCKIINITGNYKIVAINLSLSKAFINSEVFFVLDKIKQCPVFPSLTLNVYK